MYIRKQYRTALEGAQEVPGASMAVSPFHPLHSAWQLSWITAAQLNLLFPSWLWDTKTPVHICEPLILKIGMILHPRL